jgi:hypothetical protein
VEEFKNRQIGISNLIFFESDKYKTINQKDFILRIGLIFVHCFESYKIELPNINNKTRDELIKEAIREVVKDKENLSSQEHFVKSLAGIRQYDLYNYINNLILNDNEFRQLFNAEEITSLYIMLIVLGQIYSKAFEKYS